MAKLTSSKKSTWNVILRKLISLRYLIHLFDTKFQMQEIPEVAAESCSGKSFLVKFQASSFCPEIFLKN